ncbi:MAG TPA: hypothetical protein VL287_17095 [Gemmatimonadales bacterium]|jgi:hypothetical protein|nr:hypothetical protein [Gemmatimonadales bacterium]
MPVIPRFVGRVAVIPQIIGFLILAALVWMDELLDLPHVLFGAPASPHRIAEALLESVVVVLLGIAVTAWTIRAARRVAYLESFVVLCAWCRRVRHEGTWLSLEAFLAQHRARTSHGLCPDCELKMEADDSSLKNTDHART